jgi:hypothetical protein
MIVESTLLDSLRWCFFVVPHTAFFQKEIRHRPGLSPYLLTRDQLASLGSIWGAALLRVW